MKSDTLRTKNSTHLLCRWLAADSKATSDQHFTTYYQVVGGSLLKFLSSELWRRGFPDFEHQAQDLLQEMFIRLLSQIEKRPDTATQIVELGTQLDWLARGELYQRRVRQWRRETGHWSAEALGFCVEHCPEKTPAICEDEAWDLNERCNVLRERGYGLVVESRIQWPLHRPTRTSPKAIDNEPAPSTDTQHFANDPEKTPQMDGQRLISGARALLKDRSAEEIDEELGLPEATGFVLAVDDTLKCLSKLRLPVSALLYTIARNLVNDRSRRAGRWQELSWEENDEAEDGSHGNVDRQATEQINRVAEERHSAEQSSFVRDATALLRDRVDRAEVALAGAASATERKRAERRLDKERRLFAEYSTILALLTETGMTTQKELAACLEVSYDQIKYRLRGMAEILAPLRGTPQ